MTLAELKKLYVYTQEILSKNEKDLSEVELALLNQFNVSDLAELPETIKKSHKNYHDALLKLKAVSENIQYSIEKYEKKGKSDEDEVNYGNDLPQNTIAFLSNDSHPAPQQNIMAYIVRSCELLPRYRIDFELSCQLAKREKESNHKLIFVDDGQHSITLFPEDFSDEFMSKIQVPIDEILTTMSGKFDPKKINQTLSKKLALNRINEDDCLHESFGKDGYAAYFDNQSVLTPVRGTSRLDQNRKIEAFIHLYLEKSEFPASIGLNLKALLTTLPSQGALGFAFCTSFGKFFSNHGSRIGNFGQGYLPYISFDENYRLKIQVFVEQNKYQNETGMLDDVKALIKMELTIDVKAINNSPYFTLQDAKISCNLTAQKDTRLVIGKNALKNQGDTLSSLQYDAVQTCMKYLSKYLGFHSVKDFYISKKGPLECTRSRNDFELLYFFTFIEMAAAAFEGKRLTEKEKAFLLDIEMRYKQQSIDAVGLSDEICAFVMLQINDNDNDNDIDLSKAEKLDYIYWLQLAKELKGSGNLQDDNIHIAYQTLLVQFSQEDISLLIKSAKADPEVYKEITQPSSVFTKAILLSDVIHAKILGRYPSLLKSEKSAYFVKILNRLKPQYKLLFLIKCSKNFGDIGFIKHIAEEFFNEDSIEFLRKFVYKYNKKSFQYFNYLATQASADMVAYLRKPLAEVFAAYQEKILNQSIRKLSNFLLSINGNTLFQRFGMIFVERVILSLHCFMYSNNRVELGLALGISKKLAEMLNSEAELLVNNGGEHLFLALDVAYQRIKAQLRVLCPEKSQEGQDGDVAEQAKKPSPLSSDDELDLVLLQETQGIKVLEKIEKKSELLSKNVVRKPMRKLRNEKLTSAKLGHLSEKILLSEKDSPRENDIESPLRSSVLNQ